MADSTSASLFWMVCTGARFIYPVNHNEVSRPPRSLPGVHQQRLNISELTSTVVTPPHHPHHHRGVSAAISVDDVTGSFLHC